MTIFLPSIRDRVNLVFGISEEDWGSQHSVEKAAWRHECLSLIYTSMLLDLKTSYGWEF